MNELLPAHDVRWWASIRQLQGRAAQCREPQSKAPQSISGSVLNRSPPDVFWNIKRSAPHCKAQHCNAEQGMAKHHGSAICKSRFSGMFSHSKRMLRQLMASPCKASQGKAIRIVNFTKLTFRTVFIVQTHLTENHCTADQGNEPHRKAHRVCISQDALPMRFPHYSNGIPPKASNRKYIMAIQTAHIKITGMDYLLQNNPQTVDPFNRYSKAKKAITNKRTGKTEDDLIELGNIETESKLYFDDEIGVYIPTRWLTEAIVTAAFSTVKIGKDKMRGGVFATELKAKLHYEDMGKVKTIADVVMNPKFRHRAMLPQGQVRVPKDFPIFKNWMFETDIEFDDSVIDFDGLRRIVERTSKYVGFGDFRPTFGRATAEVTNV